MAKTQEELTEDILESISGGSIRDCRNTIIKSLGISISEAYTLFKPLIDLAMKSDDSQTVVAAQRLEKILITCKVDNEYLRTGEYSRDFMRLKKYGGDHGLFRVAARLDDLDLF